MLGITIIQTICVIVSHVDLDQCCYYYHGVPKNVTSMPCNPDGSTITWECQVYSPRDPGTNLSVKWYRSASGVSVREEGELIAGGKGARYSFSVTQAMSPLNDSQMIVNGLFLDHFLLTIRNYDSSIDGGYYWCQMVVNDTICLLPSNVGHIPPSSVSVRNCSFNSFDFIQFEMPRVCAMRSSCTREVVTTNLETEPPLTSAQGQRTSSTLGITSVVDDISNTSESGMMAVTLYAVIGVLAFIIAVLLLVIVAFVVITVKNHRVYEIKQERKLISTIATEQVCSSCCAYYDIR